MAALLAPLRRSAMAVGKTLHEHSGTGAPSMAAHTTLRRLLPPMYRTMKSLGIKACSSPATRQPSIMNGALS